MKVAKVNSRPARVSCEGLILSGTAELSGHIQIPMTTFQTGITGHKTCRCVMIQLVVTTCFWQRKGTKQGCGKLTDRDKRVVKFKENLNGEGSKDPHKEVE